MLNQTHRAPPRYKISGFFSILLLATVPHTEKFQLSPTRGMLPLLMWFDAKTDYKAAWTEMHCYFGDKLTGRPFL